MRLAFVAVLLIASTAASAGADFPLGRWYMEGTENGVYIQILTDSHGDSSFVKSGAYVFDCKNIQPTTEIGTWTFDGKRLTELTRNVDGQTRDPADPDNTDVFDITPIDADHVAAHDPKTGVTWNVSRVSDGALPPPAICSTT
jgi:hypothetical protein